MKILSVCACSIALLAASPCRQTAAGAGLTSVDDPLVGVREFTLQPHQHTAQREHRFNEIHIFRDAGTITCTDSEGKTENVDFNANDVRWDPAGNPYTCENLTDFAIEVVEVELRNRPANPPRVLSNLDMLIADPQHYRFVFENDQTRVLRVLYGPHEKGATHEHARPRVVVNLNNKVRAESGSVYLRKPEVHQEQKDKNYVVERIVVELE